MSTAPPTGALSRRGTHAPTRPADQAVRHQAPPGRAAETYRGLETEEPRPAPPRAGALAEASGYPPLCAHGMNSFTDRGYDLALGRLRRG